MGLAGPFALIFFGLLAFFNALRHPFVLDDVVFILKNPHILEFNNWGGAFGPPVPSVDVNTYYRPVLEIIYRLEYHLFGPHPFGFHLFNVIVHIINGLLLFGLLQKLGLRETLAWVVSLLFLIHPVQTDAVSYISGISDLWMTLWGLLALHAYLKKWYIASLLCFAISFFSKEQAVMFVPLVMVIDISRNQKNFRSWFFGILAICVLFWLRHILTGTLQLKDIMASPGELCLRLAAVPRDIGMYLRLIFFPYDLHLYRNTDILKPNGFAWGMAFISVMGIIYAFNRWPRARPTLILGLGWFLATIFPVMNIVSLINEYSFIFTPEHFLYLPMVGIIIVAVVALDHFLRHYRKLVLGIVVGSCLLLTWHQNTFWKSEITLFERMLRFEPDFGRGHLLLAKAYYFNGLPQRAEEHFQRAFVIMSTYAKKATNLSAKEFYLGFVKEILFDWAQNESAMGRWTPALDKYRQATVIDAKDASLYNNMAFVYIHLGDKKDAYQSLNQALRVDPTFTQAKNNLAQLGTP